MSLKNYFTGKPCKHGHISTRNIHGGGCNECSRIGAAKFRAENPDYQKSVNAKYYAKNSEKCREQSRAWRSRNKDKVSDRNRGYYYSDLDSSRKRVRDLARKNRETRNEKCKEWRKNNAPRKREYDRRRYANKLMATPVWFEKDLVMTVYEKAANMGFEVDHIVPLNSDIVCGLHCWDNLQLLEREINVSKNNRYWPDMPKGTDPELIEMIRMLNG